MYTNNDCEISGISVCVPKKQIDNKSILKFKDKNEFIQHTGVNRHFLDLNQKQIDLIKKTQKIILAIGDEKIIDKYDFKSVEKKITMELVKVVEFDPSKYFLNLTNTWNLNGNRTAVEEGRSVCK